MIDKEYKDIAEMGIELTAEKDESKLLDKILQKIIDITYCDSGSIYIYDQAEQRLNLRMTKIISRNFEIGIKRDYANVVSIPMEESNVCAYAAINKKMLNLGDVPNNKQFDFSDILAYEEKYGYKTKTMLVLPLSNSEGDILGVIQLINAFDDFGNDGLFSASDEKFFELLGSQAAVAITNMLHIREMKKQMNSFAIAFAEAIDARTPYNGTHTKKVAFYALRVANEINEANARGETEEYFDDNRMEQLNLAAYLHDIGKMVVPLAVMNKATRLDKRMDTIKERFALIKAYYEIDYLKNIISEKVYMHKCEELESAFALIKKANKSSFLDDDAIEEIKQLGQLTYKKSDGEELSYLTAEELECLSIQKGTLTDKERALMQSHVKMTERILSKVYFNSQYNLVKKVASSHHEYLDGSGYPHKLKAKQLGLEERILSVVDIYDALTSKDRPYKRPIPVDKAFMILGDMVKEGKLDGQIVDYLGRCIDIELDK